VRLLVTRLHLHVAYILLEEFVLRRLVEFEFVFGGSILSVNRLLLSLVLASLLSPLASADSINASMALLHSGSTAYDRANTYAEHLSTNAGEPMPSMFAPISNHTSSEPWIAKPSGPSSGNIMSDRNITAVNLTHITPDRVHNNIRFRTANWNGPEWGRGMSTPEPGSLLLLSTGLMGIAGMVRRKLRLG